MFSMVMSYILRPLLTCWQWCQCKQTYCKTTARTSDSAQDLKALQCCSFDHHFRLYFYLENLLWNSMLFYAGSNFIYVCQNYPLWEKVWLYYIACRSSFLSLLSTGFKDPSPHPAYLLSWLHLEAILCDWCTILNLYESRVCMSSVSSSHNEPW